MTCTIISTGEELNLICKNEKEPPYPQIKSILREKIWELYCRGYDRFWVNCEYGVPMWCAEIISALRMYNDIELHIAMPYEEQSTNWVEEHRNRFFRLQAESDHVDIVSNYYTTNCYKYADEHMIHDSDLLLVVGKWRKIVTEQNMLKSIISAWRYLIPQDNRYRVSMNEFICSRTIHSRI